MKNRRQEDEDYPNLRGPRSNKKDRKIKRALKTRDIDFLSDIEEEDY